MNRSQTISVRLQEVLLDGIWIANTNFKAQITSIDWQQATKQVHDLNTIAALTFHINYYLTGLLDAFETGRLDISDKYSYNLSPIKSQLDWDTLVADFLNNAQRFVDVIKHMDDAKFDQPFIDGKYGTFLRNIESVIEHSYYHLGQVVLIRRLTQPTA